MFGRGTGMAVRAAYAFICMNWSSTNDEIILIGFSRGGFAARCIAQFIHDVGLLTKTGLRHLPELFYMWKHLDYGDYEANKKLLEDRCIDLRKWKELVDKEIDVQIPACAVWDTVSAIGVAGLPIVKHLPRFMVPHTRYRNVNKVIPGNIKLAIHALALGEPRKLFLPLEWDAPESQTDQILRQRWFAGHHSDIGGGNEDTTHANITLAWMISQLMENTVQFDTNKLWAITTTRSWSKPSPNDDDEIETGLHSRTCRVVAQAPISSALLRSETSRLAYFMRVFGIQRRHPLQSESLTARLRRRIFGLDPDPAKQVHYHYSVYILRKLGIAKYTNLSPSIEDEQDPSKAAKAALLDNPVEQQPRNNIEETKLSKAKNFEEELNAKWAKHILCAHVNLRQARNEEETLKPSSDLYQQRALENLQDDASYEADIPICAILSAFQKLALNAEEGDKPSLETLNKIYADLDRQNRDPKTWTQLWQQFRVYFQPTKATFRFEDMGPNKPSPQTLLGEPIEPTDREGPEGVEVSETCKGPKGQEGSEEGQRVEPKELAEVEIQTDKSGRPILVFTRDYPLIMGRSHALRESDQRSWAEIQATKFANWLRPSKKIDYTLPPCDKCTGIWKPKTTVQLPRLDSESETANLV